MKDGINEMDANLIGYAQHYFDIHLKADTEMDTFKALVQQKINQLLVTDFNGLVQVLYRVDVAESKLKRLLQENKNEDAAAIITDLIIERLQQKIDSRNRFKTNGSDIAADEKW